MAFRLLIAWLVVVGSVAGPRAFLNWIDRRRDPEPDEPFDDSPWLRAIWLVVVWGVLFLFTEILVVVTTIEVLGSLSIPWGPRLPAILLGATSFNALVLIAASVWRSARPFIVCAMAILMAGGIWQANAPARAQVAAARKHCTEVRLPEWLGWIRDGSFAEMWAPYGGPPMKHHDTSPSAQKEYVDRCVAANID